MEEETTLYFLLQGLYLYQIGYDTRYLLNNIFHNLSKKWRRKQLYLCCCTGLYLYQIGYDTSYLLNNMFHNLS